MSSQLAVQLVITVGAIIIALLGWLFTGRPRNADVEIRYSAEAREWAKTFQINANDAREDARQAHERATRAEERVARTEAEIVAMRVEHDKIITRMAAMERHFQTLEAMIRELGGTPPPLVVP